MYSLSTCYNCNINLESVPTVTVKRCEGISTFDTISVCNFCVPCFNSSADDNLLKKSTYGTCVYCKKTINSEAQFYYCTHHQFKEFGHMHSECYKENIGIYPEYKKFVWESLPNNGPIHSILQGAQHVMNQNLGVPQTTIVSPQVFDQLGKLSEEWEKSCKNYLKKYFK